MSRTGKQLIVNALANGTVLDHIPSDKIFKVIDILQLQNYKEQITFGINLTSNTLVRKGIIKIEGLFFKDEELNRIALVAPNISVNIIKDYTVVEKKKLNLPKEIRGIAKCMNPMCVTNHEDITTKFTTKICENKIELLCHYCEKTTDSRKL